MRIPLCVGAVFLVMNLGTFLAYGSLSVIMGLEPPADDSAGRFFASVLVVKVGVAGGFVGLYSLAREAWSERWIQYSLVWWVMFAVIEAGQAIAPNYSWADALGGMLAEALYFPLAALITYRLLGSREPAGVPA